MVYANLDDVQTTLGRRIETAEEINQVNAWIADTELCISVRLGDLSLLNRDALRFVIKESVARRVRNPEGKTTERIDDYSYTLSAESAKASLYILEEEWALLAPSSGLGGFPPVLHPQWWTTGGLTETPATGGMS